jgi:predicted ATPase
MRKFVLTGGPGVGKTTTLIDLEKKGFFIVKETAREIIEREQESGRSLFPWVDLDKFNDELFKIQLEKEKNAPKDKISILDRSIVDGIAYRNLGNLKIPENLLDAAKNAGYECVFLLDRLPNYLNDESRKEDEEKANKLHDEIEKVYRELGFNVINVPALPVEERTGFILNYINSC